MRPRNGASGSVSTPGHRYRSRRIPQMNHYLLENKNPALGGVMQKTIESRNLSCALQQFILTNTET